LNSGSPPDLRQIFLSGFAPKCLIEPHAAIPQPVTLGADKGYDSDHFVRELREKAVTPHVAQNTSGRRSVISG
jgi:hypothetical protein